MFLVSARVLRLSDFDAAARKFLETLHEDDLAEYQWIKGERRWQATA